MHENVMTPALKITARDQQVLRLLVQGCSNKEIASHLNISMGIVKQHLRTLFRHAGIKESGKRVKLANLFTNVSGKFVCPLGMAHSFTLKEGMVLEGVAHGNTNKQIGVLLSTSEQVVKNYMREVMNKTGMSTRAEVAAWYFGHCV